MKSRVYSYIDKENYDYLNKTKAELILDGINNISSSRIIELAVIELRKNNDFKDIKELLKQNEMIV